jgi:hypothetical protein
LPRHRQHTGKTEAGRCDPFDERKPGKTGNILEDVELAAMNPGTWSAIIVDDDVLKNATETAWTVYRARHPDVDLFDSRRCLLERRLLRRREERESDAEELASFGLAYLDRLPDDEC